MVRKSTVSSINQHKAEIPNYFCSKGGTKIYFLGFISLQDLLEFINWVNIFMHPHFMYACVYDGRNNLRLIPKGIWIYWKIPIIPIKISPGSCWIGWKWSRRKRKDCGNRWWLKMNHVNHTANQEKSVLSRLSSMISYAITI
jgi:hypothetical protein